MQIPRTAPGKLPPSPHPPIWDFTYKYQHRERAPGSKGLTDE